LRIEFYNPTADAVILRKAITMNAYSFQRPHRERQNRRASPPAPTLTARYAALTFAKACAVHLRAAATKGYTEPTLQEMFGDDYAVRGLITKAATTPATLTGAATSDLAGASFPDTLIGLAPQSACAQLIARCLSIDLAGVASVQIPRLLVSAAAWPRPREC
jgi:hypothetical protein